MRERIIAILQKYEEQPFSRPSECADEIMALFKVAEMPTKEEIDEEIKQRANYHQSMGYSYNEVQSLKKGIMFGIKWFRNRMSSSEKPNNCTGGEVCTLCKGSGKALNVKYDLPCQMCNGTGLNGGEK